MKFLTNISTDPHFNLAFDEYCLENVRKEEPYFFLWRNRPSVIVGLNQNVFSEVNLQYLDLRLLLMEHLCIHPSSRHRLHRYRLN